MLTACFALGAQDDDHDSDDDSNGDDDNDDNNSDDDASVELISTPVPRPRSSNKRKQVEHLLELLSDVEPVVTPTPKRLRVVVPPASEPARSRPAFAPPAADPAGPSAPAPAATTTVTKTATVSGRPVAPSVPVATTTTSVRLTAPRAPLLRAPSPPPTSPVMTGALACHPFTNLDGRVVEFPVKSEAVWNDAVRLQAIQAELDCFSAMLEARINLLESRE